MEYENTNNERIKEIFSEVKDRLIKETLKVAEDLKELFAQEVIDIKELRGQVSVIVRKDRIKEIMRYLKEQKGFNHLQDLCGVDYYPKKPRFEVVYNLYSIWRRLQIRIRAKIDEETPEVESITELWHGADWHERECYDMFGIKFDGHPNLKRILMPEDWNGHPLRKDYPVRGVASDIENILQSLRSDSESLHYKD